MNFPQRTSQQKSESASFAILLYRLRDVGIFRNMTNSDYGIDFEIEIVDKDRVIGKTIKAQVKSSTELYLRGDGVPTVGGIKQSTLLYWIELSFSTPIIAFAVDITTETIYVSEPLFWQATWLLDKSDSTKTIEFRRPFDFKDLKKHRKVDVPTMNDFENHLHSLLIRQYARSRNIAEIINAHRILLKNLKLIFQLYTDVFHYDHGSEVFELPTFNLLLEYAPYIIESIPKAAKLTDQERENLFRFEYWANRSDSLDDDDVQNYIAQIPLRVLMPLLLESLERYNEFVLKGKYYWFSKNRSYLKIVYQCNIPKCRSHEELMELDYNEYNFFDKSRNADYLTF